MKAQKNKIRLPAEYLEVIKRTVKTFDKDGKVFIFGSRAKPEQKGGDIDILVISRVIGWRERRKIRAELIKNFGERKIDLIVATPEEAGKDPFIKLAQSEGIIL